MLQAVTATLLLAVALLLAACGRNTEPAAGDASPEDAAGPGEMYRVVATVGMVSDIAGRVAGDRAEVVGLIGTGIDPHLYKPTRSDIAALMAADVVLYSGLFLEGRMIDALERAGEAGRTVAAVAEGIDPAELMEPGDFAGAYDPHVWMDPSLWSEAVGVVRDTLTAHDAAGAAGYAENAAALQAELAALDEWAASVLAEVPASARVLVTAHDAFGYFGRRYGLEVLGIQGISTESEAGVRDIERLVETLVAREVPAVFVESTVSERNVRALLEGAAARGHTVRIGGELFSDAMGEPGTPAGTYIGMIAHNVATVAEGLGGGPVEPFAPSAPGAATESAASP